MVTFTRIFNYFTNSKSKNIDYIVKNYEHYLLESILEIYLTLNGFRDSTLAVLDIPDIEDFSKKFKVNVYKINKNLYLISKDKNQKLVEDVAKKYSKNFDKNQPKGIHKKMGILLDFISPMELNNIESALKHNSLIFNIYYDNELIPADIYSQLLKDNLSNKDMQLIKKKALIISKLLKKISNKFSISVEIKLKL